MRPLAKLMILAGFQIYSRLFPGKEKTANPPPNIHPKKKKRENQVEAAFACVSLMYLTMWHGTCRRKAS
ncbi:hypothetical protein NC653_025885 [Populus alba x Populus x berolinensis]|uniref:Uncharacterized protein n=1 Tax=Populus alba x Populus x berolinensis TaxID=444605 RepID=A0AAD6Q893_9ROSI|nr:hypothetical protein NC653_025885 [Populus alba x Populus x berolinensis]